MRESLLWSLFVLVGSMVFFLLFGELQAASYFWGAIVAVVYYEYVIRKTKRESK